MGHVNLLNVDTEGHDIEVVKGAGAMLEVMEIDLLQVEAAMSHDDTRYVALNDFIEYLEPMGYRLFGLYEQMRAQEPGSAH